MNIQLDSNILLNNCNYYIAEMKFAYSSNLIGQKRSDRMLFTVNCTRKCYSGWPLMAYVSVTNRSGVLKRKSAKIVALALC